MNEIKKCSIAGVSFTLENDAYDVLSNYIESLKDAYKNDPDGEEIIADIEARIAELILSAQTVEAIICRPLIDNIIKQLGSASQIDEEHAEKPQAEKVDNNGNPRIPRRLYRDMQNGKLGGVCAGLANYFDTDPTWIRLAIFAPLLVSVFASMPIIGRLSPFMANMFVMFCIGYVIMWFAVPQASSARQKLEMRGERITANNIRQATQEQTAAAPDQPQRTVIANIVYTLGAILLIILKIFAALILIGLVIAAGVLGLVAAAGTSLFALNIATGVAVTCFMAALIIPLVVLIYLSILLLISRRPSGRFLLSTLLLWILMLIGMTIAAIKSPAHFDRQISNTFGSVFSNDKQMLFEEFSDSEVRDFREMLDGQSTATFTNGKLTVSVSGGENEVKSFSGRVNIGKDGITAEDADGNTLEIGADGVKINGAPTRNFSFPFGGVDVSVNKSGITVSVSRTDGTQETGDAAQTGDAQQ